jgi:hypothetical protein
VNKTASKAPNRPVAAFSWFGMTPWRFSASQKPTELEAEASRLAAQAMRLRWQAQNLRTGGQ